MKRLLLYSSILLTALHCGAVSRVGGGKISSVSSGFTLSIPSTYKLEDTRSGVQAIGDTAYVVGVGFATQVFEVTELRETFPQHTSLGKEALLKELTTQGWREVQSPYPCAVAVTKYANNIVAYLVSWGHGNGFVMKGLLTRTTIQAMSDGVQSLKLNEENCSWK